MWKTRQRQGITNLLMSPRRKINTLPRTSHPSGLRVAAKTPPIHPQRTPTHSNMSAHTPNTHPTQPYLFTHLFICLFVELNENCLWGIRKYIYLFICEWNMTPSPPPSPHPPSKEEKIKIINAVCVLMVDLGGVGGCRVCGSGVLTNDRSQGIKWLNFSLDNLKVSPHVVDWMSRKDERLRLQWCIRKILHLIYNREKVCVCFSLFSWHIGYGKYIQLSAVYRFLFNFLILASFPRHFHYYKH